jgi:hypothetical protein
VLFLRYAEVGCLLKSFGYIFFHNPYFAKFFACEHASSNNKSSQALASYTQDTAQWEKAFYLSPETSMHVPANSPFLRQIERTWNISKEPIIVTVMQSN